MTDRTTILTPNQSGYLVSDNQRNKVLRNTYWLLALSLMPTVLGAWLGVELGLAALFRGWMGMMGLGGLIAIIGGLMFVLVCLKIMSARKSR